MNKPTEPISVGIGTSLGIVSAPAAGIGAVIAAISGNDVATASGAAAGVLATVATLGGRFAQAVALIKSAASAASPYIDGLQAALDDGDDSIHAATDGDTGQPTMPKLDDA